MPATVIIALGSNLGDRRVHLLRAIDGLGSFVRVVRVSSIRETAPVDAPSGSPAFLNMVIAGYTHLEPCDLLRHMLELETRLGRAPRRVRNEPRVIDLDLILYGAQRMRTQFLTLPHPRAHERAFVMEPMAELGFGRAILRRDSARWLKGALIRPSATFSPAGEKGNKSCASRDVGLLPVPTACPTRCRFRR